MRTQKLKEMAELSREEYEEYVADCLKVGSESMDIFTYIVVQQATEEEYMNDMIRDDAIMEAENVS